MQCNKWAFKGFAPGTKSKDANEGTCCKAFFHFSIPKGDMSFSASVYTPSSEKNGK
jgi:hypothetical protein